MSLNLLLGYTGQLSLGHVAFFGIGAYVSALMSLGFDVDLFGGFHVVHEPWPVVSASFSRSCVAGLCGYSSASSRSGFAAPISSSSRSASPKWCGWSR